MEGVLIGVKGGTNAADITALTQCLINTSYCILMKGISLGQYTPSERPITPVSASLKQPGHRGAYNSRGGWFMVTTTRAVSGDGAGLLFKSGWWTTQHREVPQNELASWPKWSLRIDRWLVNSDSCSLEQQNFTP